MILPNWNPEMQRMGSLAFRFLFIWIFTTHFCLTLLIDRTLICFFCRLGISQQPIYINVIREPLERMISYYYFLRYGDDFRPHLNRRKKGNTMVSFNLLPFITMLLSSLAGMWEHKKLNCYFREYHIISLISPEYYASRISSPFWCYWKYRSMEHICSFIQTFDECVEEGLVECDVKNLWLQIPFFCGHAAECWWAIFENYIHRPLKRTFLKRKLWGSFK